MTTPKDQPDEKRGWLQENWRLGIGIVSISIMTILAIGLTAGTTLQLAWPVLLLVMLGIVGALILIKTDRSKYPSLFAENFGWLPITVGVGTYPLWWWYSKRMGITPASQFFEISAGVLPVLLLAAVVDVRRSRSLKSYQLVLPIVAVFLGEIAALNILAFGEGQKGGSIQATAVDFAVVAASLTSTVIALVLAVLADLEES